jgi:nucleoside-diphosphate-sugar epimerase
MRVLITGAAGNLGGFLAQSMLNGPHRLRLMIHNRPVSALAGTLPTDDKCRLCEQSTQGRDARGGW